MLFCVGRSIDQRTGPAFLLGVAFPYGIFPLPPVGILPCKPINHRNAARLPFTTSLCSHSEKLLRFFEEAF